MIYVVIDFARRHLFSNVGYLKSASPNWEIANKFELASTKVAAFGVTS